MEKNLNDTTEHETAAKKRALLVSAYKGDVQAKVCEEHLQELALLAETYGVDAVSSIMCLLRKYEASTFVTKGKLEELVLEAQNKEVDLVIFDDEISPSQQRNLEAAFKIPVMDRTELILEVFAQRAQTKEARLQIELARTKYQAPRLKRLWTHLSRQAGTTGGGGAYLKGEGEKQIEIDRRIIKRKIDQLQEEIEEVGHIRETQRLARHRYDIPIFAIIGYTNAGKSTLLNALTDAKVFVEDKLFATLDTTTRKFLLPTKKQEILLIDTVGFIRKLPHLLVAAFKSTLEEATDADILLHLIDVSHPMAEEQAATTFEVLKELGAEKRPIITVFNKTDLPESKAMVAKLRLKYPHSLSISALEKTGFDALIEAMTEELDKQRKVMSVRIPQSDYSIVSDIMRLGHIITKQYEDNDIIMKVDLPNALAGKFKKYMIF